MIPAVEPAGDVRSRRSTLKRAVARLGWRCCAGLLRRMLVVRSWDITESLRPARCLVLASHPDDEVLGCGATIMRRLDEGAMVRIVIVTDGRHSHRSCMITPDELARLRKREAIEACARLGLRESQLTFLDWEDGSVEASRSEIRSQLQRIIDEFRPEEILVPSRFDGHHDHSALHDVVGELIGHTSSDAMFREYPTWFWSARSWTRNDTMARTSLPGAINRLVNAVFRLKPLLVRTEGYLEGKKQAVMAYRSQTTMLTDEPNWHVLDEQLLRSVFQAHEMFFEWSGREGGLAGDSPPMLARGRPDDSHRMPSTCERNAERH